MTTLLFVYNANSGTLNALFDAGHKLFSPSTYQCSLCALTYDAFTENKTWKTFRENSNTEMKFFHIDEFKAEFPNQSFKYPAILEQTETDLNIFLDKDRLNSIRSVEELIDEITTTL